MPIATPEIYAEMLDRAKANKFAYPAINITSSQTVTAAIRGFAEAGSDGIIQVTTGGADYFAGHTVKNRAAGALAMARFATEVAKNYPITVALHTDHCPKDALDSFLLPLIAASEEEVAAGRPVLHRVAGEVVRTAGGDLDDAVAARLREALEHGVDRLRRGDVHRGIGEAAGLRAVEHLGVLVRGCDGHRLLLLDGAATCRGERRSLY